MRRMAIRGQVAKRAVAWSLGAALLMLCATAPGRQASSQERKDSRTGDPEPKFPGTVTKAPDWIGKGAPFDVAQLFPIVPRDQNAAPLYLDAFFEFNADVADCFPAGPERERRTAAAKSRAGRHLLLDQRLQGDPQSVPPEEIDEIIKLYDVGFRKLAEAQARNQCVFETGLGPTASRSHLQAARQVARIASLRVRRATERQDFDAAIHEVETVLRMVRDLQPRGVIITQLVAAAITQVVCVNMAGTILAAPGLRVDHCDRLLKVFLDHEASSGDLYIVGLRGEYLTSRTAFQEVGQNRFRLGNFLAGINVDLPKLKAASEKNSPHPDPSRKTPKDADSPAAKTSPAEPSVEVKPVDDFYRRLLSLGGVPYSERLAKLADVRALGRDPTTVALLNMLGPAIQAFAQAAARQTTTLHATECLIAMRRWELTHRGLPRALTVAVREAGLKAIPTDPYDGKPMRLAVVEGQPVIYSVGKDGRDDGAQKDSKYDTLPGDLIYRPRPTEERR